MTNPILIEVTRGAHVESVHRGAYCVIDADGGIVCAAGDLERPVFPRSAVKPLQALPFVESGAFDALGGDPADLALACGSHSGEPAHVQRARAMLERVGAQEDDLVCAAHWPFHESSMHALVRGGAPPTRCHNNCSGKHAAFLATARQMSTDWSSYHAQGHPIQREVTSTLAALFDFPVESVSGVDGCGIPAHAAPLRALAAAFARFGAGAMASPSRNAAALRIRNAVAASPHMIAGTDRFDTRVLTALGEIAFVKAGAEGVHCAAIPDAGLGIALKIDDGGARAAEALMAALLAKHLPEAAHEALEPMIQPSVKNWEGAPVGLIRALL